MIKSVVQIFACVWLSFGACAFAHEPTDDMPADLLGEVSVAQVLAFETFLKAYTDASVSAQEVAPFKAIDEPITLHVLFGSWCHDSQREVPRIIRLVETAQNPHITLVLTAVSTDKQEPSDSVARLALKFTPTLVVLKSGQELGRIIETPEQNWASHIAAVIGKN